MTQDTDQYRAGFEAWLISNGLPTVRLEAGHYIGAIELRWQGWVGAMQQREASTPQEKSEPSAKPAAWMVPISGVYEYFATHADAKRERGEYEREMADDPDLEHVEPVPLYAGAGALPDEAKDAARWRELLAAVIAELPERMGKTRNGNAPGHSHDKPGIWDSDNGALAGKECAWCKVWNSAAAAIEAHKAGSGE